MIARLPSRNWNFDTAAHLLVRAGFGGTPAEIDSLAHQGMEAAVNSLLYQTPEPVQPPGWAEPGSLRALQLEVRQTRTLKKSGNLGSRFNARQTKSYPTCSTGGF